MKRAETKAILVEIPDQGDHYCHLLSGSLTREETLLTTRQPLITNEGYPIAEYFRCWPVFVLDSN